MDNTKGNRKRALITGASKGIGKALALVFAKHGHDLILVARDEQALYNVGTDLHNRYGINTHVIGKDFTQFHAVNELVAEIDQQDLKIDYLINNAGFGIKGNFCNTDLQTIEDMLAVNLLTVTRLSKIYLNRMRQQGHGRILHTASTAAFQPGPGMAIYFATKAYMLSLSQALWEENRGKNISVTALCPGPTSETDFAKVAGMTNNPIHNGKLPLMPASKVAEIGYRAMMRGKRVAITGFMNTLMTYISTFAPSKFTLRTLKKLHHAG